MKKVLLINIFIILIIILFIEGSLRIFLNITPQGLSDGILDLSNTPNFNYPNIKDKKVFGKSVFTDESGFRIREKPIKKLSNIKLKNIYFVGGSVTFGSGVTQSNTFSGILNSKKKNYNVINASVIGSNLKNNIDIIDKKITKKNLEYIFVNFALDDLISSNQIDTKKENINKNKNLISNLRNNNLLGFTNKFIRSKSVTYVLLKGLIFNSVNNYYQFALRSFDKNINLESFSKNLEFIAAKNKTLNDKIVFLLIPYNQQIRGKNCFKKDDAEKYIENMFEKQKIQLIKFKEVFCKDKNKGKIFLKYDPSHLSKYGHRVVAKVLKNKLN